MGYHVIDVTVVTDNANLDSKHRRKVSKDEVPCVTDFVQRLHGNSAVVYTAMAMNWRCAMAPLFFQSVTELGLSQNDLKLISVKTVTDHSQCTLLTLAKAGGRCTSARIVIHNDKPLKL
eukprot:gene11132-20017_t